MALYCMCKGDNPRNKGIGMELPSGKGGVVLDQRMEVLRIGAEQFIEHESSGAVSRHYPNTDLYRCPRCGTTIARDV